MSQQQQQHQNQLMRVPKQEVVTTTTTRRYASNAQNRNGTTKNSQNSGGGKSTSPTVTIEEVPNHAYLDSINNQTASHPKFDEEKLPVFLIKLWNIVEDSNLQSIVHWDESGASFHIADPYSFCRNVLPHFFKHNNLNSLIRQLNMYGFRKMTPLNQGGLTRTESDQDHLEFSHPCFIQNRPELLGQIKRKQSAKITEEKQVTEQTQQNLEVVMAEMRSMREKAKNMENKMNTLTKENREIWDQMSAMRAQHTRQQAYFKKLLHFLVSVMQPGISKRVAKSFRLAIGTDFHDSPGPSSTPSKRSRIGDEGPYKDVCDLLESLQRESQDPSFRRFANNDCGPLISEVTDEFGNSPGGGGGRNQSDMFSEAFPGMPRYSDHSRDTSPHPHISHPSSSVNLARDDYLDNEPIFKKEEEPDTAPPPAPPMYMGSGALTHENVHRSAPQKRPFQQAPGGGHGKQAQTQNMSSSSRIPYKMSKPNNSQFSSGPSAAQPVAHQQFPSNYQSMPPQITYSNPAAQAPPIASSSSSAAPSAQLAICEEDPRLDTISPINLSPSFDRQLSQEMQSYLMGYDQELDNFRGMMHSQNWEDANWDTFGDNLPEDDADEAGAGHLNPNGNNHLQNPHQRQLALEGAPQRFFDDGDTDLLDPLLNDSQHPENGFEVPDPNYMPLADEEIFPHSPVLRTPSPSDLV